ncbi:MAG: efflux RND transporter permease subunit [Proteobacteria bacterium]|nr:efflux RND transporter permease subunit [Pseudomonadota bacterium]
MLLPDISIKRPVAISCLIIALILLGLNAYRKMPLEFLPKMDSPFITIVTVYPGASPAEIETDIAKKIEDAVVSIDGLKHFTSTCMENVSQTFLEFELDVNIDEAANDVREKIDLIIEKLPVDAEKPKVFKFDLNARPIITFALTGELSVEELYDYADNTLRDRVSVLQGVADVQLFGGAEREVNILLDRDKLAARGLTSIAVVNAIKQGISTIPSGRVKQSGTEYSVKFDAEYRKVSNIGNLEISNEKGSRCYLKDIGSVSMATEELRQASFINGRTCIGIRVVKKADANTVKVVNLVHEAMDDIKATLPGGMDLVWVSDDGSFIQASADAAASNIAAGVLLTAAVLFIFLHHFRPTLVVAITMPVTIVITILFMHSMQFSLNTSTLLAVGLSVGILVTNSIVVMESIVTRMSQTNNPIEASKLGATDVATAVIASAGTNAVVLLPISLMGTMVGRFFNPFALTMIGATAISLFVSFTLTPMLCSFLLKQNRIKPNKQLSGSIEAAWNRMFNRLSVIYESVLRQLTRNRWAAAGLLSAVLLLTFLSIKLIPLVGLTFFGDVDKGEVVVRLEYPTAYNLEQTIMRVKQAEDLLKDLPNVSNLFTLVGKVENLLGASSEGVHLGQILIKFVDRTKRTETMEDILVKVRGRLANYPDSIVTASATDPLGGQNIPLQMEIAGTDLSVLDSAAERVLKLCREIKGIVDPDSSARSGKPELRILPRRAVLSDLDTSIFGLGTVIRGNLEGIIAGSYKEGARTYDIRVKFAEKEGKNQVKAFLFPGGPGHPITLDNFAKVEETVSPVLINRKDKSRVSLVYAHLSGNTPLATVVKDLSRAIDQKGNLPPGYTYRFFGKTEDMEEAGEKFMEAGIIAIVLTYLLLAAILESFKQPIIILFTIPMALIGFIWALYIAGKPIDIFILLGAVMLIGIVVNNAILIMGKMNQYIAQGLPRHEAMVQSAVDELRPIIMITSAAILGMLPLAVGRGLGSEFRYGIGIASVGGIFVSGLLTLVVLPVLYNLFTRNIHRETQEQ